MITIIITNYVVMLNSYNDICYYWLQNFEQVGTFLLLCLIINNLQYFYPR